MFYYDEVVVNFVKYFCMWIIVGCEEKKDEKYNIMVFILDLIFFEFCDCYFSISLIKMECKIDWLN